MKVHKPRTYLRMAKRIIFGPLALHPEPLVFEELKKLKGNVFIDIGANIGAYSVPLSKNFVSVYAFEPNIKTLPQLRKNVGSRKNVKIMDWAISNFVGYAFLHVDQVEHRPDQALGSADTILSEFDYRPVSHPEINRKFKGQNGFRVACDTFDSLFEEADLVKIDVEGAEFLVLEGMMKGLSSGKIKNVMIELHDRERKTELQGIMWANGYSLKWVDPDHLFCRLEKFRKIL